MNIQLQTKVSTQASVIHLEPEVWKELLREVSLATGSRRFFVDRDAGVMAEIGSAILARRLPELALIELQRFRASGLPVLHIPAPPEVAPELPPTPTAGFSNDGDVQAFDMLLLAILHICGYVPVAYGFENSARLIRNVVPNPRSKGQRSSHGYDQYLGFHTDNPCGEFERHLAPWTRATVIPRILGFVCLRNQDRWGDPVSTDVLRLESILERLSEEAIQCLQSAEFQINSPASNDCAPLRSVPLVQCVDGEIFFRFNGDPGEFLGVTERATWAIEQLKEVIRLAVGESLKFELTPLSILMFDNYRCCHARASFDPGDDLDNARFLRRCYGLSSTCSGQHFDPGSWPYVIR